MSVFFGQDGRNQNGNKKEKDALGSLLDAYFLISCLLFQLMRVSNQTCESTFYVKCTLDGHNSFFLLMGLTPTENAMHISIST